MPVGRCKKRGTGRPRQTVNIIKYCNLNKAFTHVCLVAWSRQVAISIEHITFLLAARYNKCCCYGICCRYGMVSYRFLAGNKRITARTSGYRRRRRVPRLIPRVLIKQRRYGARAFLLVAGRFICISPNGIRTNLAIYLADGLAFSMVDVLGNYNILQRSMSSAFSSQR